MKKSSNVVWWGWKTMLHSQLEWTWKNQVLASTGRRRNSLLPRICTICQESIIRIKEIEQLVLMGLSHKSTTLNEICNCIQCRQNQTQGPENSVSTTSTTYAIQYNLNTSPSVLFCTDFTTQCKQWIKDGDRLVILLDDNDYATNGKLSRSFCPPETNLEEFSSSYWRREEPHTFIKGSQIIDAAFKSSKVEIVNSTISPLSMSPWDNCTFICDFSTRSVLGEFWYRIVRPVIGGSLRF